jgi:thioredoxin reductase (NADPH)
MAERVVIIGSGPAGHTAAIYTGRANMGPLMFEGFMEGGVPGGQLTTTTEIENFPGFPGGISGPELMGRMREQSLHCGARIVTEDVTGVDLSRRPFTVRTDSQTVEAEALIIATGATAKKMEIPSGERLWNRGISACAVCDGALPIFRNKVLVVIGGGDTACEEATFLTHFASKVLLVHRRGELRASKAMQRRTLEHPKIEVLWNTVLVDALGEGALAGVRVKDVPSGATRDLEAGGLFFAIGHKPNTTIFAGQLAMDETGYLVTQPGRSATSVEGVFAAGDVQDRIYRQAVTAAGSGCMAALECERWLAER